MQADRRRINPPAGGTSTPIFTFPSTTDITSSRPRRSRQADEHRKIFLQTGVVPSASGSAYYEIPPEPQSQGAASSFVPSRSHLKITCTVHGPRPLPRNAAFSSNLLLTTHVKFAPFATRQRRGYVRDASERDLGVHLETALRGVVIGERWPKSSCEVVITVLEGEEDGWWGDVQNTGRKENWGMMNVLAGCITVAGAALVDAGIDCVDLISGGVAAVVGKEVVVDPAPTEHDDLRAACVVGYLSLRDEVTEMWMKGDMAASQTETLIDQAVKAAALTRSVLVETVKESLDVKATYIPELAHHANAAPPKPRDQDVIMKG